jgi:hypothetical protein
VVRRFDIAVGCCGDCGRRVQGRHRLQTSDAVGVGAVQRGPEALALAAIVNKQRVPELLPQQFSGSGPLREQGRCGCLAARSGA